MCPKATRSPNLTPREQASMKTSLRGEIYERERVRHYLHHSFRGPEESKADTDTCADLHSSKANIFSLTKTLIKAEFFLSQINKEINVGNRSTTQMPFIS